MRYPGGFREKLHISFGLSPPHGLPWLKALMRTYPEGRVLLIVASEVKDALGGHGQPCMLRQS